MDLDVARGVDAKLDLAARVNSNDLDDDPLPSGQEDDDGLGNLACENEHNSRVQGVVIEPRPSCHWLAATEAKPPLIGAVPTLGAFTDKASPPNLFLIGLCPACFEWFAIFPENLCRLPVNWFAPWVIEDLSHEHPQPFLAPISIQTLSRHPQGHQNALAHP